MMTILLELKVFLHIEKLTAVGNKMVEIILDLKDADLFVEKHGLSFEESIDMIIEPLLCQLVKHKEKLRAK